MWIVIHFELAKLRLISDAYEMTKLWAKRLSELSFQTTMNNLSWYKTLFLFHAINKVLLIKDLFFYRVHIYWICHASQYFSCFWDTFYYTTEAGGQ